ncbi:3,9-dihydroxypterocarpan 6A-monooxygenase-like [Gastrolobium bilobum]|uniref:3,9-dihydroxypterocarpan 6A-monooxygenase-like n=1 Tax=Gastrolobium bilobum TaxID=150636 RepID=UPI002AB00549|nr:3,9-dihydroxypterocarpan 6A-monooxygenase-like [Gastrolobium bilobum]
MAEFQDYVQLFFVWLVSTILVRAIFTRNQNKGHRPPSPPALPIIGHLHLISKLPYKSFHNLSTRYGPIMQLFLGSVPCIVVSNPEIAKEFLKTHETCFSNRFRSAAVHYLSYGSKGFVFAPYGSYWKFMKKICISELLGGRTLDKLLPLRQQETLRFLRLLQKKGEAGEAVDVGGELLILTNSIISRMTMNQTCSENDNDVEDIRKMVMDAAELAGKFNVSDFVWLCKNFDLQGMKKRLKEIHDRFDTMMERVIEEHERERKKRKEEGEGAEFKDLLEILLEIKEDENTEIVFTGENIKAFILEMFMAGTDTSSITTEWALAELINNPHVMEKARQEIDSVTGKSRLIQESDLINLPYMRAVVKETLRIHPTSPFIVRESSESCNVCGYEIPSKCLLFVNLWSMGRDPNLWKDPLEFRPQRFINEENQFDVRGQNFQLMPFGTGRRVCPGASLALQVVPTTLAAMIQCFEWKVDGTVNMEEKPAMTLPRAYPLICVPVPRFNFFSSV